MNYITTDQLNDYMSTQLYAKKAKLASNTDKNSAITMATMAIDNLNFKQCKTDPNQINEFPRNNESTPQAILDACCDIAIQLLNGKDPEKELSNIGIQSQGFASVQTTYDAYFVQPNIRAGIVSAVAWNKLQPYLRDAQTIKFSRV